MPDPTTDTDPDDGDRAALIERALLENQRLERDEAEADLKRQQQVDDAIIESLSSPPLPEPEADDDPAT